MKAAFLTILFFATALVAQTQRPIPAGPNMPMNLKRYFVAFLIESEKPVDATKPLPESGQVAQRHLAYVRSQVEAGKYVLAGPFLDGGHIGGMVIVNAASTEEARQIVSRDPLAQSGRATVEVHPAMLEDLSCVAFQYPTTQSK